MGKRREPRQEKQVPVRIFGTDADGRAFSENVSTVNVSREGAMLKGVTCQLKTGDVIGVVYGKSKSRFRVQWAGKPGTPEQGRIGLHSMSPESALWDFPLPAPGQDAYARQAPGSERRQHPRLKCSISAELRPEGQVAPIWGKVSDLSVGGCFVEMPIPLRPGTSIKAGLWIQDKKLWANAKVVSSRPGFGIGLQFMAIAPEDQERLRQFLKSLIRFPK